MDLEPTSEQEQIIDGAAGFFADRLPLTRLHGKTGAPDRVSPGDWRAIAELGYLGMTLPEEAGGVGYSLVEEMLVFREMGRQLAPPELLTATVAAKVAARANEPALAREIMHGSSRVAFAMKLDFTGEAKSRLFCVADARLALAIEGDTASLIDISKISFNARPGLDKSVQMADAVLTGAPLRCRVTAPGIVQHAQVLLAALFLGQAERCRDMINDYAKIRHTFGRPIGAYQAVRHPIAEMAARCEAAKCQLFAAALLVARDAKDAEIQARMARLVAFRAALKNADDNIQLHGGIGVTDEFDAHYLIKRVHTLSGWLGAPREHVPAILDTPVMPY